MWYSKTEKGVQIEIRSLNTHACQFDLRAARCAGSGIRALPEVDTKPTLNAATILETDVHAHAPRTEGLTNMQS